MEAFRLSPAESDGKAEPGSRSNVQPLVKSALLIVCFVLLSLPSLASQEKTLQLGETRVAVSISGSGEIDSEDLFEWVETTSQTVEDYFGSFPVDQLEVHIQLTSGDSMHGRTWGYSRPRISLRVGREMSLADIREHWILTHEMCHLAFPNVPGHRWLEEGMATYVEPLVQARSGNLSRSKFWSDMKWGLDQGQSEPGDRGLAYDSGWGRTYWGGALFWFVVDLELRRSTDNRTTIRDVLRRILASGGNIEVEWTLQEVLETGDRVSPHQTIKGVADRLVYNPGRVELTEIWSNLGVSGAARHSAPWASIRDGIYSAD